MSEAKGLRYNQGKPALSLVLEAKHAMEGASRVLMFGMEKYFRGNWRRGLEHTEVADCLLRHMTAYLAGEDNDKESKLPHVDHILVNALFLSEMIRTHPDLDGRPKIEVLPEVAAEGLQNTSKEGTHLHIGSRYWLSPFPGCKLVVVQRGDGDVVVNVEKINEG